jgi:hypothetical protein
MQDNSNPNYYLKLFGLILSIIVLSGGLAADAQTRHTAALAKTSNDVCPDPKKPCRHREKNFDEWELSFQLPTKIKSNVTYSSAAFYAVILKKYDGGCEELDFNSAIEPERVRVQKLLPTRKVFADYNCPNMDAVGYNFGGKTDASGEQVLYTDYIAVYAGKSLNEANGLLIELRKKYPKAEVKKMTATWERIEQ